MQEDADEVYQKALKEQLEWLQKKKGADIKADLLEERRQWILDCYQRYDKQLKFPNEFDEFYNQFDAPEEDAAAADPKGKGKDAKTKDDKAKKGKGGKKGKDEGEEDEPMDVGPSNVVQQFVEHINQYTEKWENRDESNNFDQRHDIELARKNVYPIVEAELRALVDDQMREELANLKLLFDESKKKKTKTKKPKKPKKPKPPKKWCTAVGSITNREDCVPDLVEQGILKKIKAVHLEDFWGEYHFLGAMLRSHHKFWGEYHFPPPSAQMIRSLLVEHCVLPLAQTDIRQKAPENLTARSLLLYGPKGSGKSMLARAIATETGSTFFDMSPLVIEGKSTQGGAKGAALLVYKVFICAQDMAPSVIYIDQVEQVYQASKKGKKSGDPNAPVRIKKDLSAAIKQVKRGPEATEQDRILFIGAMSKPFDENIDSKELLSAFDEKVWVSYPEYGSRVVLWQKFMEVHGVFVDPTKLNISTLARVSDGYSAGSIKQTVDRVLTARRVQQLKVRPLKVQEFIGPLSRTAFCWREEYQQFSDFDFEATGEKALHERRAAEEKAAEEAQAKGKGK